MKYRITSEDRARAVEPDRLYNYLVGKLFTCGNLIRSGANRRERKTTNLEGKPRKEQPDVFLK